MYKFHEQLRNRSLSAHDRIDIWGAPHQSLLVVLHVHMSIGLYANIFMACRGGTRPRMLFRLHTLGSWEGYLGRKLVKQRLGSKVDQL